MIPQKKYPSFAGMRIILLFICCSFFSVQSFAQSNIQIDGIVLTGKAGDLITISGRGFDPNPTLNVVYFGCKVANIISVNNSMLTVRVPQGVDGDYITVFNKVTGYAAISRDKFMPIIYPEKTALIPRDFPLYKHIPDGAAGGPLNDFLLMDVNRDGKPDIVSINGTNFNPQINISTNTSTPTAVSFTSNPRAIPTFSYGTPVSIASGDINKDGYPDLLVVINSINRILVILNTGDANTMRVDTYIDAGSSPTTIAVADMNMDGLPDIVVSNNTGGQSTLLQNTSTGSNISFDSQLILGAYGFKRIYLKDINYDGVPDIIGTSEMSNSMYIVEGTMSNGNFRTGPIHSYLLREAPSDIGFYDFTGDGRMDLALCYPHSSTISLLTNTTGSGSYAFTNATDLQLSGAPTGLSIADLNGDQKADLLISYSNDFGNGSYKAGILLNKSENARIKFGDELMVETTTLPKVNAIADLNNDNKPDIIIAGVVGHAYSVYQNNTSLAPQITSISPATANAGSSISITGTNMNPVLANNLVTIGGIKTNLTGVSASSYTAQIPTGTAIGPVTITNIDNGLSATSRQHFHQTASPSRNTLGKYDLKNAQAPVSLGFTPRYLLSADMDNDGKLDIVAADNGSATGVNFAIIQNTSSSALSFRNGPVQTDTRYQSAISPSIADFDGDGKKDLLIPMINGTTGEVLVYPNVGIANNWNAISFATDLLPAFSDAVDVDGDGLTDIFVASNSTGETGFLRNISTKTGEFKFSNSIRFNSFNSPQIFSKLVDVDGDNKPDQITVSNAGLTVSLNRSTPGNINFATPLTFPIKANPISVTFSDFDGNGTLDAIVYYTSSVLICLNESSAGNVNLTTTIDVPVSKSQTNMSLGDINGDGYPDLISANQASPWISVYPNLSGAANKTYGTNANSFDIPDLDNAVIATVTGDFNGDGRTDVIAAVPGSNVITSYVANIVVAPATQAQHIVISNKSASGATLSWTNGDGEKRAVFLKAGGSGAPAPVDLQEYAANSVFKSGDQISNSGWYCIYNGTDNSVNVSGLNTSSNYAVMVAEYNTGGISGNTYYQTSAANNNPLTFDLAGQSQICDMPVTATAGITGDCVRCTVNNPSWAIDSDTSSYSSFQLFPGVTGGLYQNFIFDSGATTDTVTIKMEIPNVIVNAGILSYIRLNSSNGSTNNLDLIRLSDAASNLKVSIDGNFIYIKYVPRANYDRFNLSIDGSGNNISAARIYYVTRMVAAPVVTPNPALSCAGTPVTLNASSLNASIKWYDAATDGNLLATGNNYTTGTVTGQQTIYAEATRISSGCTNMVRTPVTIDLSVPPTITTSPANSTVTHGGTATFSITTQETGLSYIWQEDTGSGFTNISDNVVYNGANTSTLNILQASTSMNGYIYRVVVSNSCAQHTVSNSAILTVNKKTQTLSFQTQTPNSNITATYGDNAISAAAIASSGLPVSYSSDNSNVASVDNAGQVTLKGIGTARITASQNGDNAYNAATAISFDVSVSPKHLTITASNQSKVYGTADPSFSYTVVGLVNNDVITGTLMRTPGNDVGAYPILQGTLSAGSNYLMDYVGGILTITPAVVTVSADVKMKNYGADDPAFTYDVIGLTGTDKITGSLTRDPGENTGSYNITIGTLSAGNNYTISYVGNKLTISPATLTITANAASKTYGTIDPALTYSISGLLNNDQISGALGRNAGENVGNYNITLGSISAGNNYTITFNGNSMSINPATLTINADAKTKVYGTTDPVLTFTPSGLMNSDPISGILSRNPGEDVGSYSITQGSVSAGNNYNIVFNSNSLNITPATLTIHTDAKSKVYGNTDPAFTYTTTGLVNNDQITGALTRNTGEAVGNYSITQGSLSAGNNYTVNFNGNQLNITPAIVTVTADAKTKIYGAGDPVFTYTSTALVGSDQFSGTLGRNAGEDVGNYSITLGSLSAGNNYIISFHNNYLDITPAALTIAAAATSKVYGAQDPVLTYTTTGLKNGDKINGSLSRDAGENAGIYAISQGSINPGNNYKVIFTGNTFTITKAAQTISWSQSLAIGCDGNKTLQLNATSNSGLPIGYSISNGIASINGNMLTASGSGTAIITATQAGDNNYEAAAATNHLTIMQPSMIRQHWNDVLLFDNSSNNYLTWQWYKNNAAIPGATSQYYSENNSLNGTYYVMATDKNGNTTQTCPLSVTASSPVSGGISVSPNPIAKGAPANITCRYTAAELTGALLFITDITGKTVDQLKTVLPVNQVKMPMNGGFYIITLMLSNGQRATTNVIVN